MYYRNKKGQFSIKPCWTGFIILILSLIAVLINALTTKTPTPKAKPISQSYVKVYNVNEGVITEVTAYNTVREQTDDTPCISAHNQDLCKLYQEYKKQNRFICATNAYPLGTMLYIENLGECQVLDRMNRRFKNRIDVLFDKDIARAKRFGLQKLLVLNVDQYPAEIIYN